jgi:hypothetical protein
MTRFADGVVEIERVRSYVLGPTVARLLYENKVPYYTLTIGGPWGLDPALCWCCLCGDGFGFGPTFALATQQTSEVWRADQRVGKSMLFFHKPCVRLAESSGVTPDEMQAELAKGSPE